MKEDDIYAYEEAYRDKIDTVDAHGKRLWVFPKKPKGSFHNLRIVVAIVLLTVLFGLPLLKMNGEPFMLINVFERRFIFFGVPFWPQDFHILALMLISFVVFIVLFTVVFGRIWCGWACPQTIFMEMVFRKIEYLIEGNANQQRKLAAAPWTFDKILKKGLKQIIFILISLLISHTVMAYLISVDQVIEIVSQPPSEHLIGFIGLMAFTAIFYFVFSWFREQACTVVCPYGRLQGVFLGNNSIAVMYDWLRGEPRGRLKKEEQATDQGDCVDCKMCVHVCPTGIDIRNGTQLECVNCTACMDACDEVMDKVNKPKGLIRYASYSSIKEGTKKIFTARVVGYTIVLAILLTVIAIMLNTRTEIEATVLRVPGMLYQKQGDDRISNLYNIQFVNKTFHDVTLEVKIKNIEGATIKRVGEEALLIPASTNLDGVFFVEIPRSVIVKPKTELTIQLFKDGELIDEVNTNFLGPV